MPVQTEIETLDKEIAALKLKKKRLERELAKDKVHKAFHLEGTSVWMYLFELDGNEFHGIEINQSGIIERTVRLNDFIIQDQFMIPAKVFLDHYLSIVTDQQRSIKV